MCGIFGVIIAPGSRPSLEQLRRTVNLQYRLSESRGSEASGWAIRTASGISTLKRPINGTKLARSAECRRLFDQALRNGDSRLRLTAPLAVIGHSRMVTNGRHALNENNQPVEYEGVVGIHNGIIVNDESLWRSFPALTRRAEVDTEVLMGLIRNFRGQGRSIIEAARQAFGLIEGAASVAVMFDDDTKLLLATNTGSLYVARDSQRRIRIFASEEFIVQKLIADGDVRGLSGAATIEQLRAGRGLLIDLETGADEPFELAPHAEFKPVIQRSPCDAPACDVPAAIASLRRCSRCVLPESFPFIRFNAQGVCNYCENYQPMRVLGEDALREQVDRFRSRDGRPDCIVAFSGGRDSSYGLHYLKTKLGLHPIAYTYDWGLVTDLARRNQARLCGKLGVEHILISADIARKRDNVRRNIEAWLRKPDLGMVPLFMAGDKQFFHYANVLKRRIGVQNMVFSVNPLEKTSFKTGFCGVDESGGGMYFNFPLSKKLKFSSYYLRRYLTNPAYLNRSLLDTAWAFSSAFFIPHDYLMLFDYIRWDEREIDATLRGEYDWELAPDTTSTWRIGDGTAAFYNYIYYTVAGFTENDTFRSNQVREGVMTREQALALVNRENQPRWESIHWYAQTIGFDWERARRVVDAIPRLYAAGR